MLNRYPTLLPLLALIGGILAGGFISVWWVLALVFAGISFALLIILYFSWQKWHKLHFLFLFLTLGFTLTIWQNQQYRPNHFTKIPTENRLYVAEILEAPKETKRALRLELKIITAWQDSIINTAGKTFLYTAKRPTIQALLPGDLLLFDAQLQDASPPQNPYEFDYQNYLHLHQIYGQGYSNTIKVLQKRTFNPNRIFSKIRNQFFGYIQQMNLAPEEEAVASALLLGYRHLLTDDTQRAFSGAGAMHVLAVSGLHVGILYIITAFLLRIDKKKQYRNKWPKVLLVIVIIWLYAAITGLSPSVSRAAVMFTFIACGNLFHRKPATYQAIIASAIFLLLYDPSNLFQVGFQLSYAAVFGILYLQPKIYGQMPQAKNWLFRGFWEITAVSLAAQAVTFPLSLYYFHQFPVFFLISNLLVIPLAWLLMNFGIFLLAFSVFFMPPLWLVLPFQYLLKAMIASVHFVENLPHAVIYKISIGRFEMVLITILVFACAEVYFNKKKRALFLSMGLSICLLAINLVEIKQQKSQQKITFYSIKKETAIEIVQRKNTIFIADKKLIDNEDAMLFHVRHNQWAAGIFAPIILMPNQSFSSSYLQMNNQFIDTPNQRILLMHAAKDSLKFDLNPTYIFVKSNVYPPHNVPPNSLFILENGHSEKGLLAWKLQVKNLWPLQEKGALELTDY